MIIKLILQTETYPQLHHIRNNNQHRFRPDVKKYAAHAESKAVSAGDIQHLQNKYQDFPKMTLMVRTGAVPRLLYQFYCMFLRTTTLFWPAAYGDIAIVLDAESEQDHVFGEKLLQQFRRYYQEYNLKVYYEDLPKDPEILQTNNRSPAYVRQLWSTFFADLYSKERIIAYMDTDTLFLTPMTKEYLMDGKRLKVFGSGDLTLFWVPRWENTTKQALGLPMVVNFMITFPQLLYRDTYQNCRAHIMRYLNVTDFEKAFSIFHSNGTIMSPINIIMSYAWFFEHDRYDWHIKVNDLETHIKRLPTGHEIQAQDIIPGIVGVAHVSDVKKWKHVVVTPGYCLSMSAQGQPLEGCRNVTHNLEEICDFYEDVFHSPWPSRSVNEWCRRGNSTACCQRAVDEHYKTVSRMHRMGMHSVRKKKAELVELLAREMGLGCEKLCMP